LLDSEDTDEILVDKLPLRPLALALALALAEVDSDAADLVTVLAVTLVSEFFRTDAGWLRGWPVMMTMRMPMRMRMPMSMLVLDLTVSVGHGNGAGT
jgi:hypothetical protein